MIIGVPPKEIKNNEFRVAITAAGVHEFRTHGHTVLVERGAGLGSGITDEEYSIAGAEIVNEADDVWGRADMVMKVKEPIAAEYHASARASSSSPTCTLPQSPSSPPSSSTPASRPSLTKPCRKAASFRCSPRCPRSQAACPSWLALPR